MKVLINVTALLGVLSLVGCTGLFESKTCGIKNSQWQSMSYAEQLDVTKSYNEKQQLAERLETNKLVTKQQKNLADARKDNEKAQKNRMNEERNEIEKQQLKIDLDLEQKQRSYAHPEITPVNQ